MRGVHPLMMGRKAATYIGTTFSPGDSSAHNLALPAGAAADDLAIAINGYSNATPSGFTELHRDTMSNNGGQWYQSGYKVLTTTDIANGYITFPNSGFTSIGEVLAVYRGPTSAAWNATNEPSASSSSCAVNYALNSASLGVLAYCVDRDGYATGSTIANATKLGGAPAAGGGTYGVLFGHNLAGLANGATVTFGSLATSFGQIGTLIDLL